MRLQHGHLGVEGGFDLGELDLSLRLHLEMDRVVLCSLLPSCAASAASTYARASTASNFGSGGGRCGRELLQQAFGPRAFILQASSHTITILPADP